MLRYLGITSRNTKYKAFHIHETKRSLTGSISLVNFSVLTEFKKLYGHLDIPVTYVIGSNPKIRWPKHLKGFELGRYAKYIRHNMISKAFAPEIHKKLVDLGFATETGTFNHRPNLASLIIYKSIFGHLNIPTSYQIGQDEHADKWPVGLLGRRLGDYAQGIRRALKRNIFPPEVVQQLRDMQFPFSGTYPTVQFEVLQAYKAVHGDLLVPHNYVVPSDAQWPAQYHGMKLGEYVQNVRRQLRDGDYITETEEKLRQMGMKDSIRAEKEECTPLACEVFVKKYGHGIVNNKFIVPSGDSSWPRVTWGLRLGDTLMRLRHRKEVTPLRTQLEKLGISFASRGNTSSYFERCFTALQVYKSLHEGSVKVPIGYVVPTTSSAKDETNYPVDCRGLKLGLWLREIRSEGTYAEHRERLLSVGVVFPKQRLGFNKIFAALSAYKAIHGNLSIPIAFVVPTGDASYDQAAWGFKLGRCLYCIKQGVYKEHREKLIGLGIPLDETSTSVGVDAVHAALVVYKSIHNGSVSVPKDFVVPLDDERYPEETRGYELGERLHRMCREGREDKHAQLLTELGVEFKIRTKKIPFSILYDALTSYKAVHGNLSIPLSFVVPEGDANFDKQVWGLKLGQMLKNVRRGLSYKDHKQALVELGVEFSNLQQHASEFEIVCDALQTYKQVNQGLAKVPIRFVIPVDDERYPEGMRGLKLGTKLRFYLERSNDEAKKARLAAIAEAD